MLANYLEKFPVPCPCVTGDVLFALSSDNSYFSTPASDLAILLTEAFTPGKRSEPDYSIWDRFLLPPVNLGTRRYCWLAILLPGKSVLQGI